MDQQWLYAVNIVKIDQLKSLTLIDTSVSVTSSTKWLLYAVNIVKIDHYVP